VLRVAAELRVEPERKAMNPFSIGIPGFVACVVLAYVFREIGVKHLDVVQAGTLVLKFRPYRIKSMAALVGILVLFLVLRFLWASQMKPLFLAFLLSCALCIGIFEWQAWKELKKLEMPKKYLGMYGLSRGASLCAYAFLIGAMAATQFVTISE
jgi:hypothetical protein